ncbi:MAG: hypothetical protein DLM63_12750 [Solirubrobacterales bacterium]|nr:MAG: hypothetical protein DLM63_12750 [Solirubrobacterales bacterium]
MSRETVNPAAPHPRRHYHSPKRAQAALATRRRIRAAAERLFLADGYAPTKMSAIAKAAGVSEPMIFLAFETKAALLGEIIQVAVRGDDEEITVSARQAWRQMLALPAEQLLERFAQGTAAVLGRTARLLALGEVAADSASELAIQRDRGHAWMRSDFHEVATALAKRKALADTLSTQDAADTIYAVANGTVYLRLTQNCDWTPTHYANWLTSTLTATLLKPGPRGRQ